MGKPIHHGGHWKVNKEQLKKYLPNAYYYLFYGALGSLFPFLNLYYRSIGLNPWHIGILGGLRPFVALFSGPFWCYISNQYKIRKCILLASLISWVAFSVPLGFIDHGKDSNCPSGTGKSELNRTENLGFQSSNGKRESMRISDTYNELPQGEYLKTSTDVELESGEFREIFLPKERSRRSLVRLNAKENPAALSSRQKDLRFINLEKPIVNSYSLFGMRLQKNSYKSKRKPYDFKSRGSRYANKRINPYAGTIFIEIFFIVLLGEVFQSPTDDLDTHYDGTFLEHLGVLYQNVPNNSMYSSFGIGFFAFFTGLILTFAPKYTICGDKYSDYRIAFYIFGILMTLALVISVKFCFTYRRRRTEFAIRGSIEKLCVLSHIGFVLIVLLMGAFRGFLFNFLFWNIAEIGGSELVVGVTVVSQYLSDMIMNISSPILMTYMGYVGMVYCGLASYGLRFLIYSWLSTPNSAWAIPSVELLQGISHSTAWSAFMLYVTNYTPRSTYPVGVFILQGLYLGVGSCVGALVGGGLIEALDTTVTFRIFGLTSLLACLVFTMLQPTGMDELLPSEVDAVSYFADEDDYSSLSEEELFRYDKRNIIYIPSRNGEDGIIKTKKAVLPSANAPFVPIFMSFVKKDKEPY